MIQHRLKRLIGNKLIHKAMEDQGNELFKFTDIFKIFDFFQSLEEKEL